jgi:hypothetical protein
MPGNRYLLRIGKLIAIWEHRGHEKLFSDNSHGKWCPQWDRPSESQVTLCGPPLCVHLARCRVSAIAYGHGSKAGRHADWFEIGRFALDNHCGTQRPSGSV